MFPNLLSFSSAAAVVVVVVSFPNLKAIVVQAAADTEETKMFLSAF